MFGVAGSFTPPQPTLGIAHGDVRVACSCLATETHLTKLPTHCLCDDIVSRGNLDPLESDLVGRKFHNLTCGKGGILNYKWLSMEISWLCA